MRNNKINKKHDVCTFVLSLLSMVFMVAGCTEPNKPDNGGGGEGGTSSLAAPVITQYPSSQTVMVGNTATFSVTATATEGATLSYQWKKAAAGFSDFADIEGATGASYTTPKLGTNNNGIQYLVVVTAKKAPNLKSHTTSNIATITVSEVLSPHQMPKIVWTHIDGTKKYSTVPVDGILVKSVLTSNGTVIKSVDVIPSSITRIGHSAFSGCIGLTSITIPTSVTSIDVEAFKDCIGLTSITIPTSVTSIDVDAFKGCSGLTSITIPSSVTSIGLEAFKDCSGLKSVTIGNGVTSIGERAFSGCIGLTSITLPSSVTSIGSYAFSGCIGLTRVIVEATQPPIAVLHYSAWEAFYYTLPTLRIEVPSASVAAYKMAHGWQQYASQIDDVFREYHLSN